MFCAVSTPSFDAYPTLPSIDRSPNSCGVYRERSNIRRTLIYIPLNTGNGCEVLPQLPALLVHRNSVNHPRALHFFLGESGCFFRGYRGRTTLYLSLPPFNYRVSLSSVSSDFSPQVFNTKFTVDR